MNIIHNKMVKFITQLRGAVENDATRTSEVSKYQLISQPKLNKFQLQCYSRCSKWRSLVSTQQRRCLRHWSTASSIIVAETQVYMIASVTKQRVLGSHRLRKLRTKGNNIIMSLTPWH